MLARDSSVKGKGMGDFLLASAFHRIKEEQVAGYFGVELLAGTAKLVVWYEEFGFIVLKKREDGKTMMFIHRGAIP